MKTWTPVSEAQALRILSDRVKHLRRARGWSQEQLAERAAMQRSYVADLERGRRSPSVRTLVRLANAIGVSLSALFDERAKRTERQHWEPQLRSQKTRS